MPGGEHDRGRPESEAPLRSDSRNGLRKQYGRCAEGSPGQEAEEVGPHIGASTGPEHCDDTEARGHGNECLSAAHPDGPPPNGRNPAQNAYL